MKPSDMHEFNPGADEDERILAGLLDRYKTFLFAPDVPDANPSALAGCVDKMMQSTQTIRSRVEKQPASPTTPALFSRKTATLLALAASLLLIIGGSFLPRMFRDRTGFLAMETMPARPASEMRHPSLAGQMNSLGLVIPRFRSEQAYPLFMPHHPPIAYVFSAERNTLFHIGAKPSTEGNIIATTAFALFEADKIEAMEGADGIVVHPDRVTHLPAPGRYRLLQDGKVMDLSSGKPLPSVHVPGILSPQSLLTPDPLAKMAKHAANWVVLMPAGTILTTTPDIVWLDPLGDEDAEECQIFLAPLDGSNDTLGPPAIAQGGILKWDQTGWPPLPRGTSWQVVMRRGDRLVSSPDHAFQVMPEDDAHRVTEQLKEIQSVLGVDHPASLFAQASVLLLNQPTCAAEARQIVRDLREQTKENILYLCLMRRAFVEMGLHAQAREVDGYIQSTIAAHHSQMEFSP